MYENYTFEMNKTKKIFDFLIKERRVILRKEEINGKECCKYHKFWNHITKGYWALHAIIQDNIDKSILKFPTKETMVIE